MSQCLTRREYSLRAFSPWRTRMMVSMYCPLGKRHSRDQSGIDPICIKLNDCLYRVVRVNMHISAMEAQTQILKVEKDGEDGLIVTFSDGTTAGYVVEELLGLRPL